MVTRDSGHGSGLFRKICPARRSRETLRLTHAHTNPPTQIFRRHCLELWFARFLGRCTLFVIFFAAIFLPRFSQIRFFFAISTIAYISEMKKTHTIFQMIDIFTHSLRFLRFDCLSIIIIILTPSGFLLLHQQQPLPLPPRFSGAIFNCFARLGHRYTQFIGLRFHCNFLYWFFCYFFPSLKHIHSTESPFERLFFFNFPSCLAGNRSAVQPTTIDADRWQRRRWQQPATIVESPERTEEFGSQTTRTAWKTFFLTLRLRRNDFFFFRPYRTKPTNFSFYGKWNFFF